MKKILPLFLMLAVVAASSANAKPVLRAVPKTVTLKLGAQDNDQLQTIEADIRINQIYSEYVKKTTTCSKTVCEDIDNDGSKGDWKNFFSVSKSLKPRALASAIKGIGETTAERIIDLGYFTKKPRSWSAFSNEILNAQQGLNRAGYNYNFSTNVLEVYGYENAVNLGYYADTACHVEKYDCSYYVEVEREEFYKYVPVTAKVVAKNMVLQSFEKDTFYITLNDIPGDADITLNAHNRYTADVTPVKNHGNYETNIELIGTERIKGNLPYEAVNATLARDSKGMVLNISVDSKYFTKEDAGSKNIIKFDVCRSSWVGSCYEVVRSERVANLQNVTSQSIRLDDGQYSAGRKYFVRYSVTRAGSRFYADKYVTHSGTYSVKY
ncbi:MAG: hypothetical protein KA715_05870 [Xanthomonadaceae bacterium]|nr:hypothetical protein [Xanthomonadaceae bacterium]